MENAGFKIECVITREDGSVAQRSLFEQFGLTDEQLNEVQDGVVPSVVQTILSITAGWNKKPGASSA